MKIEDLDRISKSIQISNFVKIRPMEVELFHADGRRHKQIDRHTDMTELIVAFHNVANAPKIGYLIMCISRSTIDSICYTRGSRDSIRIL